MCRHKQCSSFFFLQKNKKNAVVSVLNNNKPTSTIQFHLPIARKITNTLLVIYKSKHVNNTPRVQSVYFFNMLLVRNTHSFGKFN